MISGLWASVAINRSPVGHMGMWSTNAGRLAAICSDVAHRNWVSGIASAVVLGLTLHAVRGVDWTMLGLALSASGLFWLVFAANYFHAPIADAVILGPLWSKPRGLLSILCRKQIANAVSLPLAGDGLLLAWAHSHNIRGFGAIKDAALVSGIVGSLVTFAIVLPVWTPLADAVGLAPSSLFGSLCILSAFPLVALFKRADVFTLASADLCRIGAIHAGRIIANIILLACCWHLLLPAEPFQSWLMLAAARMVVSRLPLLPNKELALVAVAAAMFPANPGVGAAVMATGVLLTLAHMLVWGALSISNRSAATLVAVA